MKIEKYNIHVFLKAFFLFMIVFGGSFISVKAQNNRFKIDDELYSYYEQIYFNLNDKNTLLKVDTLIAMSDQKMDVKAHCIALTLKALYYYRKSDLGGIIRSKNECENYAIQTPYKQYIFDPWNRLINYYSASMLYFEAMNEMKEYHALAFKLDNDYGIVHGYRKLGDLYTQMGDWSAALNHYKKAEEAGYQRNYLLELYDVYSMEADIHLKQNELKKARDCWYQTLKERLRLGMDCLTVYSRLELVSILMNERPDSVEYFRKQMELERQKGVAFKTALNSYYYSRAMYNAYKGRFQEAMNDTLIPEFKYKVDEYIGTRTKNFRLAYDAVRSFYEKNQEAQKEKNRYMLTQASAQSDRQKLEREKEVLSLQNTQMALQQAESREKIMLFERERNQLELRNKQLDLDRETAQKDLNKAEADIAKAQVKSEHEHVLRQRDKARLLEQENEYRSIQLYSVVIIALIIILFVIFVYRRNKIQNKRLMKEKAAAEEARKIAECEREVANVERTKAENADSLKSLFLQNMSHEIRTPLNAIVGFNDVLNGDMADSISQEERSEFLRLIRANADLLTTLVNDILDLSKLESGTYSLNLQPSSVNEICKSVLSSIQTKVPEGVVLKLEVGAGMENAILETDVQRLEQLLINFLTNACKYTEQGSITLAYSLVKKGSDSYSKDSDMIRFSVTDTGCGISDENADRVFNRFEKLNSFKQGTGLGLNICSRISALLKGYVFVDKSYKNGACFVFMHPINETIR